MLILILAAALILEAQPIFSAGGYLDVELKKLNVVFVAGVLIVALLAILTLSVNR